MLPFASFGPKEPKEPKDAFGCPLACPKTLQGRKKEEKGGKREQKGAKGDSPFPDGSVINAI